MKFIHTSNWQIGAAFAGVYEQAAALRQARIDAVKQIIALAEREKVDFVIAAGDLFEDNRLSQSTIESLCEALCRSTVPIYLLPGCRDPLTQDSPYIRFEGLFKPPVYVLSKCEPVTVPEGTLYPTPCKSRSGSAEDLDWIPERSGEDGIRIGIACGTAGARDAKEFPLSSDAAEEHDLDYLALGHWRAPKKIDGRTWYSGPSEPSSFDETDAGKVLLLTISEPEEPVKIKEVPVYSYTWQKMEARVNSEEDVDQLIDDINEMSDPQMLIQVAVTGRLPGAQLHRLQQITGERFFHFELHADVTITDASAEYRHPLLRQMAEELSLKAAQGGEDSAVAQRALAKLSTFVKQAGFQQEEA